MDSVPQSRSGPQGLASCKLVILQSVILWLTIEEEKKNLEDILKQKSYVSIIIGRTQEHDIIQLQSICEHSVNLYSRGRLFSVPASPYAP